MILGLFGSFFLAGIVVGSVTVTRIGDTFGRREGFAFGLLIMSLATLAIMVTTSYKLTFLWIFIIGFASTGK